MSDYISREAAIELLSEPITMSMCLSTEECHHKIAQQRIDRYLIENIPAAEAIEELSKPRWIPVTEQLPDAGERVLCYCRANIYEVMKMRTDGDWVYDTNHVYMHSFVTHWMPLPEPPKEE